MSEPASVVSIAAINGWGHPLFGLRKDSKKWTFPSARISAEEDVTAAAVRVLEHQTGLIAKEMLYLGQETVDIGSQRITVHAFRARVKDTPAVVNEPDRKCSEWKFIRTPFGKLPPEIANNLHNPIDVTLDFLGYQRWRGPDAWRREDHHFWSPEPEGPVRKVYIDPDVVMDEAMYRPKRPFGKD